MKKILYLFSLLILILLVGCNYNANIEINISDKIIVNNSEEIALLENNIKVTDKVSWTLSSYEIGEINNGIFNAKKTGKVLISAIYKGEIITKEIEIINPYVEEIIISGKNEVIVDKSIKLEATVIPSTITSEITWESMDKSIATVYNGAVKGLKIGETDIVVTCDNFSKTYHISVIDYPKTLQVEAKSEIGVGEVLIPVYNVDDEVVLKSLDETIAEAKDGDIIGVKAGVVTIEGYVKNRESVKATFTIEVVDKTSSIIATEEEQNQIDDFITKMNTRQLVGELFNIEFSAENWSRWGNSINFNATTGLVSAEYGSLMASTNVIDYISSYPFGNYTLFTSYSNSRSQLEKAITTLKGLGVEKTSVNPFIFLDYSGGLMYGLNSYPEAYRIGEVDDLNLTYSLSNTLGKEFRSMGINGVINNYINTYYPSTMGFIDEFKDTLQANSIKRGYQNNNIVTVSGAEVTSYSEEDLKRFKYACMNNDEILQVPYYYALIKDEETIYEKTNYIDKIRSEYKYNGVVMLDFKSSKITYDVSEYVNAIINGYDMINFDMHFPHNVPNRSYYLDDMEYLQKDNQILFDTYDALINAINDGTLKMERVKEAVSRILLVKLRNNVLSEDDYSVNYDEIAEEMAYLNTNFISVEGTMGVIDKTKSTIIISDITSRSDVENSFSYTISQHFKEIGYSNYTAYTFRTYSMSTLRVEATQYDNIYIMLFDMYEGKEAQSQTVVEFIQELQSLNPNICLIVDAQSIKTLYFEDLNIKNYIYLNSYYDSKFSSIIKVLDGEGEFIQLD